MALFDVELEELIKEGVQGDFRELVVRAFFLKQDVKHMLDSNSKYLTSEQLEFLRTLYKKLEEALKEEEEREGDGS